MESKPDVNPARTTPVIPKLAVSNARILWCSIGLTILASLMVPVPFGKKYKAEIAITATGLKDETVKGIEVWVREENGPGIVAKGSGEGWIGDETVQASYGIQPATIKWEGAIDPEYQLNFVRHPASGRMILTINGQSRDYILYSATDLPQLQIRPYLLISNPEPVYTHGLLKLIISVLIIFCLIHLFLWFSTGWKEFDSFQSRFASPSLAILAIPSLLIYTFTLLAMWPGQMSPDSVSHWVESETRSFGDAHPALLTMALWLVTRIWHSPTVIPIIQILALTGVTVLLISKLSEIGCSRAICILLGFAFPLYPANFLMVTTIWKDVPYTIALLFSFWLLISLTDSQGKAAQKRTWKICFISALTIVMFSRHNGPLIAFGLPLICALSLRKSPKRFFIGTTLALVASYIIVKSVLFPLMSVVALGKHYRPINAIHLIGAHVSNGSKFTDQQQTLLQSVYTLEQWKSLYNCQSVVPIFFGDASNKPPYDVLAAHANEFIIIALKKSIEHPGVFWRHLSCTTSILWRILPARGDLTLATPLTVHDDPIARRFGLIADPKLRGLHKTLRSLTNWTLHPGLVWFFWRPGLWLLLSIISCVALVISMQSTRYLLLLAPSLLNTLSLAPAIASPEFRYQWVVSSIGIFLVPLALFRKWTPAPEPLSKVSYSMWSAAEHLSPRIPLGGRSISGILPAASPDKQRIAVVIPCYRVRDTILPLLNRIGPECSLIFCIDDKCPENSGSYIQEHIKDHRVRVLFHETNQGVGGAVLSGYRAALLEGATVMVKLDGDGQMDPLLLPAFVAPIVEGTADYTKGNRFFRVEDVREMPALRLFGNAVLSFMTKLSSGYWSTFDPTNGYTAIHASVAQSLPFDKIERRYFFESDMLFRLNVLRARVIDIPMTAVYRGEKSSLVISSIAAEFLWKHVRNFAKRIGYNYFLRDFSIASLELLLGLPLVTFGFFFGLHSWIVSLNSGVVTTAGTVMLSVLPSILGVQFLLSFVSHDILRTPAEPIHKLLVRLPNYRLEQLHGRATSLKAPE